MWHLFGWHSNKKVRVEEREHFEVYGFQSHLSLSTPSKHTFDITIQDGFWALLNSKKSWNNFISFYCVCRRNAFFYLLKSARSMQLLFIGLANNGFVHIPIDYLCLCVHVCVSFFSSQLANCYRGVPIPMHNTLQWVELTGLNQILIQIPHVRCLVVHTIELENTNLNFMKGKKQLITKGLAKNRNFVCKTAIDTLSFAPPL